MVDNLLDKDLAIPLYYQMMIIMERRIKNGEYKQGEKIPNEYNLSQEFGVSRITVRRAVSMLVDLDLLKKNPPLGTFVNFIDDSKKTQQEEFFLPNIGNKVLTIRLELPLLDYSLFQAIQEFEAMTGIEVKVQLGGAWNNNSHDLLANMINHKMPDLFLSSNSSIQHYAKKGIIQSWDNYIPKDKLNILKKSEKEIFFNQYLFNNILYGVPFFSETRLMYFRKDHFNEIGLEGPPVDWTHKDFLYISKQLMDNSKSRYAFAYPVQNDADTLQTMIPWIQQRGGRIFQREGDKVHVKTNDESFIDAFSWYCNLTRLHKICPKPTRNHHYPFLVSQFINGKISMLVGSPSLGTNLLERKEYDGIWGIAPLPSGSLHNKSFLGRMPICMSNHCTNPDVAWSFVSYITSRSILFPYTRRIGVLPPIHLFNKENIIQNIHPALKIFVEQMDNTIPWDLDSPSSSVSVSLENWQTPIQNTLYRCVLGELSPAEACSHITLTIQDLMKSS